MESSTGSFYRYLTIYELPLSSCFYVTSTFFHDLCEVQTVQWNNSNFKQYFQRSVLLHLQQYKPPTLEVVLGPVFTEFITMFLGTDPIACTGENIQCSVVWGGSSSWLYDDLGLELRPFFKSPLTDTSNWKTGTALLGFTNWNDPQLKTRITKANTTTYYFRKNFNIVDTGCFSALQVNVTVDDGVVLYLNGREMMRLNMPNGTISNATMALSSTSYATWQTFTVSLPGENNSLYLVEGSNTLAAEVHTGGINAIHVAFDICVSGTRRKSCSTPMITPEVCDGVDNNLNGQVDEDGNGNLLTRVCRTACGPGIETCIAGIFQRCTAPLVYTETYGYHASREPKIEMQWCG